MAVGGSGREGVEVEVEDEDSSGLSWGVECRLRTLPLASAGPAASAAMAAEANSQSDCLERTRAHGFDGEHLETLESVSWHRYRLHPWRG